MTTINILDWQGDELLQDYADFVLTGTAEAKAIASKRTGAMVESVVIKRTATGFLISIPPSVLRKNRRDGKRNYYPYTYAVRGYKKGPQAFHFIKEGFENVAEGDHKLRGVIWSALKPSNKRGSGISHIGSGNKAVVNYYVSRKGESRVRIPASIRK